MDFSTIIFKKSDTGVATICLNRPEKLNALNEQMKLDLVQALNDVIGDANVRVLVLKGAGRAFCAGGDIEGMVGEVTPFTGKELLKNAHEVVCCIWQIPKPVIAAVRGYAVGAGWNIALASDIIIASERAVFGQAFVKIGLITDMGGAYFLPRVAGLHRAKELVFGGDNISAAQAYELGLVNRVIPDEEFEARVDEFALRLAGAPTKAIGLAKTLLNRSFESDLSTMLELEAFAQSVAMQTSDFQEGVLAFLEKRKPVFKGK